MSTDPIHPERLSAFWSVNANPMDPSKQAFLIQQSLNKLVGATGEQLAPGAVPQQPVLAAGLAPSALTSLQTQQLNNMVAAIQKQAAQNAALMQSMQNVPSTSMQGPSHLAPLDVAGEFGLFYVAHLINEDIDSVAQRQCGP
ncbi:hypothetical protein COOONC_04963 [Cooperia oncophora]